MIVTHCELIASYLTRIKCVKVLTNSHIFFVYTSTGRGKCHNIQKIGLFV